MLNERKRRAPARMRAPSPGASVDESRKRQGIAPCPLSHSKQPGNLFRRSAINVQLESPSEITERRIPFNSPAAAAILPPTQSANPSRPRTWTTTRAIARMKSFSPRGLSRDTGRSRQLLGLGVIVRAGSGRFVSVGVGESVKTKRDNARSQTIFIGGFCYLLANHAAQLPVTSTRRILGSRGFRCRHRLSL